MSEQEQDESRKKKKKVLTERQVRFIHEYLFDMNKTQAAIRAGYARGPNDASAAISGHRLYRNAKIQKEIKKLKKIKAEELDISVRRVIKETALLAFSRFDTLFKESFDGRIIRKEMKELTRDELAVVRGVAFGNYTVHDKLRALELLAKMLGMFSDETEAERKKNADEKRNRSIAIDGLQEALQKLREGEKI